MLANNLDLIDLAILERENEIRRRMHRLAIAGAAPSPWASLRALVTRLFGTRANVPAERPVTLTLVKTPASVADDAFDRAA